MAGCKKVQCRMCVDYPIPVMFTSECKQTRTLGHVPHFDRLILTVTQYKLLLWMEYNGRNIVVVTTTRVHFPCFCFFTHEKKNLRIKIAKKEIHYTYHSFATIWLVCRRRRSQSTATWDEKSPSWHHVRGLREHAWQLHQSGRRDPANRSYVAIASATYPDLVQHFSFSSRICPIREQTGRVTLILYNLRSDGIVRTLHNDYDRWWHLIKGKKKKFIFVFLRVHQINIYV